MASAQLKEVLVIGGTGAQGLPVVHGSYLPFPLSCRCLRNSYSRLPIALSNSGRYAARVLTRNLTSERARNIAKLPNVSLIQGSQDSQEDLHKALNGVWGAWVNTEGFTIGEKNELFYGIRAYEIARHERVQHYVYASTDYAVKVANWNEKYHWGHNDAKGRVADFVLAQGQEGMTSSVLATGPYMNMLYDGMFVPQQHTDSSFVWANPASKYAICPPDNSADQICPTEDGKFPLIALEDIGAYSLWMFDNIKDSAGLKLNVATDEVSFADIATTFTQVTGKPAAHQFVPLDVYLPMAEPFPHAPANWAAGPTAPRDESTMTWRANFSAWWSFWGEGWGEKRDWALLDKIHPQRIKSLKEWMEKNEYDGQPKAVLKGAEDLRSWAQAQGQAKAQADVA